MKRRSKDTAKRRRASTASATPITTVQRDLESLRREYPASVRNVDAAEWERARTKINHLVERIEQRHGAVTTWQRDGMGGLKITPRTPEKPRRKPSDRTVQILKMGARLEMEDKPRSLVKFLMQKYPGTEKHARARYAGLKSDHPTIYQDFQKKYRSK